VSFWRHDPDGDQLTFLEVPTGRLRPAALDVPVKFGGCIDTWSDDSRWLASGVFVDGASRIVVVDSRSGVGRFVTPKGVRAQCPRWSPDGAWFAFTLQSQAGTRSLAVIRTDGSDQRVISGRLGGLQVSGPDTWSPDGAWIYFDATRSSVGRVFRAHVGEGESTPLTDTSLFAVAPASSPDGTKIAFIVARRDGWDVYVASSDGRDPRRVAEHAENLGWSADGRSVLLRWTPPGEAGGLAIVSPDGSGFKVVVPADQACPDPNANCDLGWGQARP
jgi:Tol biopolymer transport system component